MLIENFSKVLVVVAHPDDEVLGAGAVISRLVRCGAQVGVLVLSEGAMSRMGASLSDRAVVHENFQEAMRLLGVGRSKVCGLPDNQLDSVSQLEINQLVESEIAEMKPQLVLTHSRGDLNRDHVIVHDAVLVATRPTVGNPVTTVFAFEVPSSSEWNFGHRKSNAKIFVEVAEDDLRLKCEALATYKSELRDFPDRRSVQVVQMEARLHGSVVGVHLAECFDLIRHIETL